MLSFDHFFSSKVISFVSDCSIDFTLPDNYKDLSKQQKKYLNDHLKLDSSRIFNVRQIHGTQVLFVGRAVHSHFIPEADGALTNISGITLAVRTADCLSIFLYDPMHNAIGLVHAGWKGSREKIVVKAINMMQKQFHTDPSKLKIAFGPSIKSCCYTVGEEFKDYFPKEIQKKGNDFYLDLPSVNKNQLYSLGIKQDNIHDCKICTCCDKNYFSYRRQKDKAGRMLSLMMLKS